MSDRLGDLPDGHGFAREHCLVALEPGGLDEAQVGRDDVAGLEEDDVVRDDGGDDLDEQFGWDVSEDESGSKSDTGCGCSSSRSPAMPGSLLLVLGWMVARGRRSTLQVSQRD